jgi:hypothetical protein
LYWALEWEDEKVNGWEYELVYELEKQRGLMLGCGWGTERGYEREWLWVQWLECVLVNVMGVYGRASQWETW